MDENSAGFRSKEEEQAAEGFIAPNTGGENVEIPSTETESLDAEIQNLRSMLESLRAELPSGPGDLRGYVESLSLGLEDIAKTKDMLASRELDDKDLDFNLPRLYQRNDLGLGSVTWKGREGEMSAYYRLLMQFDLIRSNIQSQIEQKHHLEPINAKLDSTFDPAIHEDNQFNRLPAGEKNRNNQIYESLRPGFIVGGKVKRKAMVKRFVAVETTPPTDSSKTDVSSDLSIPRRFVPKDPKMPWRG